MSKLKTLLLAMILCGATIAHAQTLIDRTPGGFNPVEGLPPAFFELQNQTFFDEAAHGWFNLPEGQTYLNGWVSRYGALNGGTYFFTNLFTLGDTPSASIWWDFLHTGNGLTMIDVSGTKADGTPWEHIYSVRFNKERKSPAVNVTLDGMTFIRSIAFYGWAQ
jgi:hypothetical protein